MLRLLALIAALFALILPLFLPRSMRHAKAGMKTSAAAGSRGGGLFRGLLLALLPYLPRLLAMLFGAMKKPACNRCGKPVNKGDTTCKHCGNVLTDVRYTVQKATAHEAPS